MSHFFRNAHKYSNVPFPQNTNTKCIYFNKRFVRLIRRCFDSRAAKHTKFPANFRSASEAKFRIIAIDFSFLRGVERERIVKKGGERKQKKKKKKRKKNNNNKKASRKRNGSAHDSSFFPLYIYIYLKHGNESPWRGKINLMANEFLPSSTLGQLRRGVKGLDGKRAPEVSREEGRRHEKVRQQKGLYRVARHSTLVPPNYGYKYEGSPRKSGGGRGGVKHVCATREETEAKKTEDERCFLTPSLPLR